MRAIVSMFCIWAALASSAWALGPDKPLADVAQEARAIAIFKQLRCVVCQSESVADSPADVAVDMRREIRKQITTGKTNKEIIGYFVAHYGDAVLMRPPLAAAPMLWITPLLLLLFIGVFALHTFRKQVR